MQVETDDYIVLVEEFRTDHDCTRSDCTDPFGVSRIILDRVIAGWPEPSSGSATDPIDRHVQPDFEDLETVTVVGVLTRKGHNLADPESSQRMLIAYSGQWQVLAPEAEQQPFSSDTGMLSNSILMLDHTISRGYLTFERESGFAPMAWYAGHHTDLSLESVVEGLHANERDMPPLKPVCLNQIDDLPEYDPEDTRVHLIVASTSSTNEIRFPARLFFITGLRGAGGIAGIIHHGNNQVDFTSPGALSLWERDFLRFSDGCACIVPSVPFSVEDALSLIDRPVDDAWTALCK